MKRNLGVAYARGKKRVRSGAGVDEPELVIPDWPTTTSLDLGELLDSLGCSVNRTFGNRLDSRSVVLGIQTAGGHRYIVKHAVDDAAVAWLHSARRFHADVRHPAIPTVLHQVETANGFALVEEWGAGEILADGYDDAVLPPDHADSAYQQFLRLDVDEISGAIDQLIDAHVAVVEAGYVTVDLYDGCVLYDFSAAKVALVDLDHYRPGPYVLDVDRQLGSASYMAPEEFCRGATVDERSTVFTLGRMTLVYLGCARKSAARRTDFRGTGDQFAVANEACAPEPDRRIQSVRELQDRWRSCSASAGA